MLKINYVMCDNNYMNAKGLTNCFVDIHDDHTIELKSQFSLDSDNLIFSQTMVAFMPISFHLRDFSNSDFFLDFNSRNRLIYKTEEKKAFTNLENLITDLNKNLSTHLDKSSELNTELIKKIGRHLGDLISSYELFLLKKVRIKKHNENNLSTRTLEICDKLLDRLDKQILGLEKLAAHYSKINIKEVKMLCQHISYNYTKLIDKIITQLSKQPTSSKSLEKQTEIINKSKNIIKRRFLFENEFPELHYARDFEDQKQILNMGYLKKYFQSSSYIKQEKIEIKSRFSETIAMLGAAIAGISASLVSIYQKNSTLSTSLQGISLIAFGIVIYVFKDRIKDLSKKYLIKRVGTLLPDKHYAMLYGDEKIGTKKLWLKLGLKSAPEQVKKLKKEYIEKDIQSYISEEVLTYRSLFEIKNFSKERRHFRHNLRWNIHRHLKYLDDPQKTLRHISKAGTIEKKIATRVYPFYLGIILSVTKDKKTINEKVKLFKVEINKNGVHKVKLVNKAKIALSSNKKVSNT